MTERRTVLEDRVDRPAAGDPRGRHLPALLGIELVQVDERCVTARLPVRQELLAPTGYLHAATLVALADTACGYGTLAGLPDGAGGFATIELHSSFLRTTRSGLLCASATRRHAGRMTQVWEAEIHGQNGLLALFGATQMILHPAPKSDTKGD
jgi:uncharacterized protein (TIGR00369 family)